MNTISWSVKDGGAAVALDPTANGDYRIMGYASTFGNVDLVGDRVVAGAFKDSIAGRSFPVLWAHDVREPIGHTTNLVEDDHGLAFSAVLVATRRGLDTIRLLKSGSISGVSIGYNVIDARPLNGVRELKRVQLVEISCVVLPANELARVIMSEPLKKHLRDIFLVEQTIDDLKSGVELHRYQRRDAVRALAREQERNVFDGLTAMETIDRELGLLRRLGR